MIRVAQRLGRENFARYVRDFGFGAPTGVELPGESAGLLRPTAKWSALSLPSISFGQEIGVTALQMTMAAAAVANGGYLMKPIVVRRVEDAEGRLLRETKPLVVRRVLEPDTVDTLTDDPARRWCARAPAGAPRSPATWSPARPGTAQKVDASGRYSMVDHVASFVGFVPAARPALVVLASLDTPRGARNQGGDVAAPLFARVAEGGAARARRAPGRPGPRAARGGRHRTGDAAPAAFRPQPPCARSRSARRGAGPDARPARTVGTRGGDRRRAPRPGRRAARIGAGRGPEPRARQRDRAGQHLRADARRGSSGREARRARHAPRAGASRTGDPSLEIAEVDARLARAPAPGRSSSRSAGSRRTATTSSRRRDEKGPSRSAPSSRRAARGPGCRVPDAREALALLSAAILGDPARALELVGVTGTNGKTTTTLPDRRRPCAPPARRWASSAPSSTASAAEWPRRCARHPSPRTCRRCCARWWTRGCRRAVLEVSSHSLALKRVHGFAFKVAVFTNLTRDHLDFHGDMDAYFAAKRLLFETLLRPDGHAVVNLDDDRAPELVRASRGRSGRTRSRIRTADLLAEDIASRWAAPASARGRRSGRSRSRRRSSAPSTSRTCSRRSARGSRSGCHRTPSSAGSPRSRACRAAWNGSSPGRTSRCSSTTRTPTTRSGTCSRPCAAWRRAA